LLPRLTLFGFYFPSYMVHFLVHVDMEGFFRFFSILGQMDLEKTILIKNYLGSTLTLFFVGLQKSKNNRFLLFKLFQSYVTIFFNLKLFTLESKSRFFLQAVIEIENEKF
jgi:hypothetical protein